MFVSPQANSIVRTKSPLHKPFAGLGLAQDVHVGLKSVFPDTERLPDLAINRLPVEVLSEIFDFYRQNRGPYGPYNKWKKEYEWFNLAHVCVRWRAVMLTSISRWDLSIAVGPQKPGDIKTVLSSPWLISIEYDDFSRDITDSAISRMRTALEHRDRVREISLGGGKISTEREACFTQFIRATNFHYPALETLTLYFPSYGHKPVDIPATFLTGPDQLDLHLQRLRLFDPPLASVSGLLLSATALTHLDLNNVIPNADAFNSSEGSLLLKCLQGMKCLRSLDISTRFLRLVVSQSQLSTPNNIVPLSKLSRFHYLGSSKLLNDLVSGLSAPSLHDAEFELDTGFPLFSRVFDDMRDEFRSIRVSFSISYYPRFVLSIHSVKIDHLKPSFKFTVCCSLDSIKSITSTKLAMTKELGLSLNTSNRTEIEQIHVSLCDFLRQFSSVKVLWVDPESKYCLQKIFNHARGIFPLLEEIKVSVTQFSGVSAEGYQRRAAEALAAFEPFVLARERAGRLLKLTIGKSENTGMCG